MPTTALQRKSKLLTVLLAFLLGSVGAHRFYLKGRRDFWAWTQVIAMVLGAVGVTLLWTTQRASTPGWICAIVGGTSVLAGYLSALVYGLRADEKWDAQFNADGTPTRSGWPVVLLSILTLMIGTALLMAGLAITFQTYFETQVQAAKELSQ
ncbi:MAG: NINE protein [Burkholderiaceae bacterium]|jgi:TM2 domain-containing membrane protein YozV|nr:NINE protein [Burkholderiaceae bacterium]